MHLTVKRTTLRDKITDERFTFLGLFVFAPWEKGAVFKGRNRVKNKPKGTGDTIATYYGEITTYSDIYKRYGITPQPMPDDPSKSISAPYIASISKDKYIDCSTQRCVASMINTYNAKRNTLCTEQKGGNNAELLKADHRTNRMRISAIRDLYHDDEIFFRYTGGPGAEWYSTLNHTRDENADSMTWDTQRSNDAAPSSAAH